MSFYNAFQINIPIIHRMPYLYRYENKQWINEFFETGKLKLTSFNVYKNYNDNELGDKKEGHSMNFLNGSNGFTFSSYSIVGMNEYCFCTSTVLDKKLKNKFKRDSVFKILDPFNFMLEITKSLVRVNKVMFGHCSYVESKMQIKNLITEINLDNFRDNENPNNLSLEKLANHEAENFPIEQFFLKDIKYQEQSEYRILWSVDNINENGIFINCPEAIKFCEQIKG